MTVVFNNINQALINAGKAMAADIFHFHVKELPYGSNAFAEAVWASPKVSKDRPLSEQTEQLFAKSISSIGAKRLFKTAYYSAEEMGKGHFFNLEDFGATFAYKILPRVAGDLLVARAYVVVIPFLPAVFEALPRPIVKHVITETFYPLKARLAQKMEGYYEEKKDMPSLPSSTAWAYDDRFVYIDNATACPLPQSHYNQESILTIEAPEETPKYLLEEMYASGVLGLGVQIVVSIIFTNLHIVCLQEAEFKHEKTMRIGTVVFLSTLCAPLKENIMQVTYVARDTLLEVVDLLKKNIAAWWVVRHPEATSMPSENDTNGHHEGSEECAEACVPLVYMSLEDVCTITEPWETSAGYSDYNGSPFYG